MSWLNGQVCRCGDVAYADDLAGRNVGHGGVAPETMDWLVCDSGLDLALPLVMVSQNEGWFHAVGSW